MVLVLGLLAVLSSPLVATAPHRGVTLAATGQVIATPQDQPDKPGKSGKPATKTVRMTARILDTAGLPIAAAGLTVCDRERPKDSRRCLTTPDAKSGTDGRITWTVTHPQNQSPVWLLAAEEKSSLALRVHGTKQQIDGQEIHLAELGDVVMRDGTNKLGLVRDANGKLLAGAKVVATGILSQILTNRRDHRPHSTICYGVSDAKGRVRLAGIPRHGVRVKITAAGYYEWHLDYLNRHMPLVATLDQGSQVTGIVRDQSGQPINGARVFVLSESTSQNPVQTTKADGRFKLDLPGRGRYRIRYYKKSEGSTSPRSEYTKIFQVPRQDLELRFGQGALDGKGNPIEPAGQSRTADATADATAEQVTLRIVAAKTGMALRTARAAAVWWQPNMFEHNHGYLERQLGGRKAQKLDEQGNLRIPGPSQGRPNTGRILVAAKGFAPYLIKDVEWDADQKNEFVVKMVEEATVSGIVVDPVTGEPLAGVRVIAVADPSLLRRNNPQPFRRKLVGPHGSATTDVQGRFRLGELPGGSIQIYVAHKSRADIPPIQVELEPGKELEGQRIEYRSGGSLFGKLTGAPLRPGWKVRIRRTQKQAFAGLSWGRRGNEAFESAPVDDAGDFAFHGLSRASYTLSLMMPYPHGTLAVAMEPIRMRTKDLRRSFDISEDLPGRLKGTIKIEGGAFPPGRLMLLAQKDSQNMPQYFGRLNLQGDCTFLDRRGQFNLPLSDGAYQLLVIDLSTKLTLLQTTRPVRIQATKTTERDLTVKVAPVTVTLAPETAGQPLRITRIEVQATHPAPPRNRNFGVFMSQSNRDTGIGCSVQPGQTQVDLMLPAVPCKLLARSYAHNLDPKVHLYNFPAQGEVELTPELGQTNKVEILVSAPQIDLDEQETETEEKKREEKEGTGQKEDKRP